MKIQRFLRYAVSVLLYLVLLWIAFNPESFSSHTADKEATEAVLAKSGTQQD